MGKSGQQGMAPKLIPGTEGTFGAGSTLAQGLAQQGSNASKTGLASLAQGAKGGYMPQILPQIEQQLLPALQRSFGRGEAAIRESAANSGTLRSSGTVGQATDLYGGLESGLLQQLAGIQGQLGVADVGARLQAGQSLAGFGPQALGGLSQFQGSGQYYQPTQGPSGKEKFLSVAAPIAGFAIGGPAGAALGSSVAGGLSGGGGGGGGKGK